MDQVDITRLQESLDNLAASFNSASGRTSGATSQTVSALRSMTNSFVGLRTASDAVEDRFDKLQRRSEAYETAISRSVRGIINLTSSAISTTQSLYQTSNAFAASAAGLQQITTFAQGFLRGLGDLVSIVPKIGAVTNVFTKGVAEALGIINQAVQFQLGAMQNQLDSYKQLSAAGATFGGSLFNLQNSVAGIGVPMQSFVKLVGTSADSLALLGGGMTTSTKAVLKLTKDELMLDSTLVGLTGGFDELAASTAQFAAQQNLLGKIDIANLTGQTAAVKEYIRNQKIVTEFTGKRAQELVAEERRRMSRLGFQTATLEAAKTNQDAAANMNAAAEYFAKFGPTVKEAAEQMALQGRQGLSPEVALAMSRQTGMLDLIEQMMSAAKTQQGEQFRQTAAGLAQQARPGIEAEIERDARDFARISDQITGPGKALVETAAAIRIGLAETINFAKVLTATVTPGTEEGIKGINTILQNTETRRLDLQAKLDVDIAKSFTKMTELVELGFKAQQLNVAATSVIVNATGDIAGVISRIGTGLSGNSAGSATGTATGNNDMPKSGAENGGVVSRPTVVGEDFQPEAVIPLAKGNVPLNIDWSPLVNLLEQQVAQNEEMSRALKDSRELQERLLYSMG